MVDMLMRWLVILLLGLLSISSQAQALNPIRMPDVPYGDDHQRQQLDIYMPEDANTPLPTIFMVHGGGYVFGSKEQVRRVATHYASLGYAVVAPSYRLAPEALYPAPIEDVFCALGWMLAHADDYGFDTEKIILMGESAGANAVSLLATVDDTSIFDSKCDYPIAKDFEPLTAILYYMPVGLTTCECNAAKGMAAIFFGVPTFEVDRINAEDSQYAEASPILYLDKNDPPMLLIHGTEDSLVPISESVYFVEQSQNAGIAIEFFPIERAGHGFFSDFNRRPTQESLAIVLDYLEQFIGDDIVRY